MGGCACRRTKRCAFDGRVHAGTAACGDADRGFGRRARRRRSRGTARSGRRRARWSTRRPTASDVRSVTHPPAPGSDKSHSHLTAEFIGVPTEQLRDTTLLGGLLIAAASAAGFSLSGVPNVREHPSGGVSAVLLLENGHIALHSVP